MIELGKTYRDVASGFTGMATGRAEYLEDTPSIRLTARAGSASAVVHEWFPEGRLELVDATQPGFASA